MVESSSGSPERAELIFRVGSGELSSPRLVELWRDLNIALADVRGAELEAMERGESTDESRRCRLASERHGALYEAVITEAERVISAQGEVSDVAPSNRVPTIRGLTDEQSETVAYIFDLWLKVGHTAGPLVELANERIEHKPGEPTYLSFLFSSNGTDLQLRYEVAPEGGYRKVFGRTEKRDRERDGRGVQKVGRGIWTDEHGWWLGPAAER